MARACAQSDSKLQSTLRSFIHSTSMALPPRIMCGNACELTAFVYYLASSSWPLYSKTNPFSSTSPLQSPSSEFSHPLLSVLNLPMVKKSTPLSPLNKQRKMQNTRPASLFSQHSATTSSPAPPRAGLTSSRRKHARQSTQCASVMELLSSPALLTTGVIY